MQLYLHVFQSVPEEKHQLPEWYAQFNQLVYIISEIRYAGILKYV